MLKIRGIKMMGLEFGNAYGRRRRVANTHTVSGQTRKDIVKRMIGMAALARCFSFATPVNSERTIIWQRSSIPL